jgi:hypothetical protein
MLEFTSHPEGIEGFLADVPREPLCKVDGETVTIPIQFPAMVGMAYAAVESRHGTGPAMIWAMQVSLGSAVWDKLLNVGLSDEHLTLLTTIVVARMQGESAPIPEAAPPAPKARAARRRAPASKK